MRWFTIVKDQSTTRFPVHHTCAGDMFCLAKKGWTWYSSLGTFTKESDGSRVSKQVCAAVACCVQVLAGNLHAGQRFWRQWFESPTFASVAVGRMLLPRGGFEQFVQRGFMFPLDTPEVSSPQATVQESGKRACILGTQVFVQLIK